MLLLSHFVDEEVDAQKDEIPYLQKSRQCIIEYGERDPKLSTTFL